VGWLLSKSLSHEYQLDLLGKHNTTSQVYLGTSDVIKLVEYEYTLKYCTVLRYQCKLHYTVYSIHGRSEQTDKTTVYSERLTPANANVIRILAIGW